MIEGIVSAIGSFLAWTWWLWAFLILAPVTASTWLFWRQKLWEHSSEFEKVLLEIRIPRENTRSPKGMEQIVQALYALRNTANDFQEVWWDGEVSRWFSLELVSFGGDIHFYIRTYFKYRPIVQAAFYSFYPDLELVEVEDYVERFPETLEEMYAQGYDLWGGELKLAKESAYPIKSYLDFEAIDEEKQYDPISQFVEILGQVRREQTVAIQILIQGASAKWHDEYQDLVQELKQSKAAAEQKKMAKRKWDFSGGPLPALSVEAGEEKEAFGAFSKLFMRTPGETDVLKAVEANLSMAAFKTVIRFIYFSPVTLFYDSFPRRGVAGAFNQYAAQDLNSFLVNYPASTRTKVWNKPYIFPRRRNEYKKNRILWNYKHREILPETFMGKVLTSFFSDWNIKSKEFELTTRSIATIFHPPTSVVLTAPHIQRVESRKAGPPAGLAIYGEEKEIEKYH